jgi:hypothetical protein
MGARAITDTARRTMWDECFIGVELEVLTGIEVESSYSTSGAKAPFINFDVRHG